MSFEAAANRKAIDIGKLVRRDDHLRRQRASFHRPVADAPRHRADVSPDALGPEGPVEPGRPIGWCFPKAMPSRSSMPPTPTSAR